MMVAACFGPQALGWVGGRLKPPGQAGGSLLCSGGGYWFRRCLAAGDSGFLFGLFAFRTACNCLSSRTIRTHPSRKGIRDR